MRLTVADDEGVSIELTPRGSDATKNHDEIDTVAHCHASGPIRVQLVAGPPIVELVWYSP
jgi:hypothetical protein